MHFTDLHPVAFNTLHEDEEFWKPLTAGKPPRSMNDLLGPYDVYAATGHVLNKRFLLKNRLQDHELRLVAFDAKTRELFLMEPSDVVYVLKER